MWSLFPAVEPRASYDTSSQRIELHETSLLVGGALALDPLYSPHDVLPTLHHETRHWLDHVTTVWGRRRLASLFEATRARELNNESEFQRIIDYRKGVQRDFRTQYYTTIESTPPPQDRHWACQYSMGREFDRRGKVNKGVPIVFARFQWVNEGLACRVPMSTASLLETNAVHFQIEQETKMTVQFAHKDRLKQELDELERRWFARLYMPELGRYSIAVHAVANHLGLRRAREAYRYSAALASVALNLPGELIERIRIPSAFARWGDGNTNALRCHDRGYVYLALLHHAGVEPQLDPGKWVDAALVAAGLQEQMHLTAHVRRALARIVPDPRLGPYPKRWNDLADAGLQIFDKLGIRAQPSDLAANLSNIPVCPVFCTKDRKWIALGLASPLHNLSEAENWSSRALAMSQQFADFVDACVS